MEILLPRGVDGDLQLTVVNIRKLNYEGQPIGIKSKDPILYMQLYEI